MMEELLGGIPAWLLPILASAVGLGIYDIAKKDAVNGNSVMPVLFFATLSGSVFFLTVSLFAGDAERYFHFSGRFFLLVWLKSMLVASSWICVYYAMRELPVSIASPIRASSPVWTVLGGIVLFREIPTFAQGLAMLLIFAGYYVFSVLGKLEGISFARTRGIHLILLGTVLGSCSALYDKFLLGVEKVPRDAMQFWFSADLVAILGIAWGIRQCFGHRHPFVWKWSIPLTGILLIGADWLYFYALSMPDTRISILSLLRRCSCLVTFVAGSLWFHDVNVRKKAWALFLILAGVILLALKN